MTRIMIAALALLAAGCTPAKKDTLTPQEARAIAKEATIYGFPLVDNYRIQHSYFVDQDGPEYKAPWNTLNNTARVYTPDDKAVQTPNSDTPYSQLGADLRTEPLVITVPAIEPGRYYSLQFIDQHTYNFAYVGSRATGNEAGSFLLAGPGWRGEKPEGIKDVIRSETDLDLVLFRTQLFDAADLENVKKIQAGYKVQTLSSFLGQAPPAPAPAIDFPKPLTPEQQRSSPEFFDLVNFVLQFAPTHPSEQELMARFAKLNIGGGKDFGYSRLSPELQQAVRDGMADAWTEFADYKRTEIDTGKRSSSDSFGTREFLNGRSMDRLAGAVLGIYGNSKEEAIYPAYFVDAAGEKLDGHHRYEMRLGKDQLPPVNAFWSLTVYEMPASLLYANPINRYLINSPMLDTLKRDKDGTVTLYIQHESPGKARESNWLPVPEGPFLGVMRLYWPKAEALDGRWTQPALVKVD